MLNKFLTSDTMTNLGLRLILNKFIFRSCWDLRWMFRCVNMLEMGHILFRLNLKLRLKNNNKAIILSFITISWTWSLTFSVLFCIICIYTISDVMDRIIFSRWPQNYSMIHPNLLNIVLNVRKRVLGRRWRFIPSIWKMR